MYADLKRYDDAIAAFYHAIALDPADAYSHNGLGNVYFNLKQYDAAIAAFHHAIALDPALAYPHHGLGNTYRDLKQYEDAIAAYHHAIALDPTYPYPHTGLGNAYSLLNQLDKARASYQRAFELDSQDYQSMFCLARIERLTKNQDQAEIWIEQARQLLPDNDFYNRACLESVAGNVDAAVEALRVALERQEVSVEWARQDPDFEFIRDDPRYRELVGLDNDED
jgi:tetratricopeptide (TPR) repeat protein